MFLHAIKLICIYTNRGSHTGPILRTLANRLHKVLSSHQMTSLTTVSPLVQLCLCSLAEVLSLSELLFSAASNKNLWNSLPQLQLFLYTIFATAKSSSFQILLTIFYNKKRPQYLKMLENICLHS